MQRRAELRLEALVDFVDDATSCPFPITADHIDSMMAALAGAGVGRAIWAYYGDGHGGYLMPFGGDSSTGFDQDKWRACAATYSGLGNPLAVAAEAAHSHGIECYAYFKPYETGIAMTFTEGSPQAREWGRLPHLGGCYTWLDPFVVAHPHLRIQRRTDDLPPGVETAAIRTLRLTKKDDSPTRVTADHLQIWTSDRNYRYTRKPVDFDFAETVEPSPREVRDVYGNLLTAKGAPVRVLTLSGLDLTDRYILVTTDFTDGRADFENAWDRILTALDADGREIPGVFATGSGIWFPEWEDFRSGGLYFDTGRGPEAVTLDLPNGAGVAPMTGSNVHFAPGQKKVQGVVAYTRGRNAYLPGALCETEPEVQDWWLSCAREILDAGVDGVEVRVENHSTHTDTPGDYGFNPAVMQRVPEDSRDLLADISRVRGDAYTEFLRRVKEMVASRGKRMRINLNVDWFRPAAERPGSRRMAYPANIDFDWRRWIDEGLLDEAMLRVFAAPFDGIFEEDATAQEMIGRCRERAIPITVNRYVNPGLVDEFERVRSDGRFAGFVLYETCSYMDFAPDGGCSFADAAQAAPAGELTARSQGKLDTSAIVQQVCRRGLSE